MTCYHPLSCSSCAARGAACGQHVPGTGGHEQCGRRSRYDNAYDSGYEDGKEWGHTQSTDDILLAIPEPDPVAAPDGLGGPTEYERGYYDALNHVLMDREHHKTWRYMEHRKGQQ